MRSRTRGFCRRRSELGSSGREKSRAALAYTGVVEHSTVELLIPIFGRPFFLHEHCVTQ